jgi:hypothetical protein
MVSFFERVRHGRAVDFKSVAGYSNEELSKIERLYDINITGDFRAFMLEMGRCSGGLIGDDPIILYRPTWSVRTQILVQVNFFSDLQDANLYKLMKPKPFVFSIESETHYYFLFTGSSDANAVYHYDENSKLLTETGMGFADYMADAVQRYRANDHGVVCRGELIVI